MIYLLGYPSLDFEDERSRDVTEHKARNVGMNRRIREDKGVSQRPEAHPDKHC